MDTVEQVSGSASGATDTGVLSWRAAQVAAAGLAVAGGIHLAWALGLDWPAADRSALARLVVGAEPFPSAAATASVTVLLESAAAIVLLRARRARAAQPASRLLALASGAVAACLLARGAGGMVVSAFGLGEADPGFRFWDLRLYSPLCLALGGLTVLGTRTGRTARGDHHPDPNPQLV